MVKTGFNLLAASYSAAIISAAGMLLLTISSKIGLYTDVAQQMIEWHMFYSLDIIGTITGMIESAIIVFVFVYAFGWVYKKLK